MKKLVLKQRGENDQEALARDAIKPGMKLYGFLGGLFGRGSYGEKTVVEVEAHYITAMEDGVRTISREIDGDPYTWVGVLEDSNRELGEIEEFDAKQDAEDTFGE